MRKAMVVYGLSRAATNRRRSRPEHVFVAVSLAPATVAATKVGPSHAGFEKTS
jgi:hypothetical protein